MALPVNKSFVLKKYIPFPRDQNWMEMFFVSCVFRILKHEVCTSHISLTLSITVAVVHHMVMQSTLCTNSLNFLVCVLGRQLSARVHHHRLKYTVYLSLCILLCNRYQALCILAKQTLYIPAQLVSPLHIWLLPSSLFVFTLLQLHRVKQNHAALSFCGYDRDPKLHPIPTLSIFLLEA